MNIALGALILFLLLFPGILLRIAYLNGPYSRKNIQSSLVDELVLSLVPSLFLQCIGYAIAEYWLGYDIHLESLYQLTIGANNPQYKPDFAVIESGIVPFFWYNVVMFVVAALLGKLARTAVERFDLDIHVHSLRINNDWYYLLSGRILNFPGWSGNAAAVEVVFVDLLVETKEGSYIYCGVLDEFYLSKDGLDRVCLSNVFRRKLEKDLNDDNRPSDRLIDDRYYKMPGDLFVIPYSHIRNINLTYYQRVSSSATTPV